MQTAAVVAHALYHGEGKKESEVVGRIGFLNAHHLNIAISFTPCLWDWTNQMLLSQIRANSIHGF